MEATFQMLGVRKLWVSQQTLERRTPICMYIVWQNVIVSEPLYTKNQLIVKLWTTILQLDYGCILAFHYSIETETVADLNTDIKLQKIRWPRKSAQLTTAPWLFPFSIKHCTATRSIEFTRDRGLIFNCPNQATQKVSPFQEHTIYHRLKSKAVKKEIIFSVTCSLNATPQPPVCTMLPLGQVNKVRI